MPQKDDLSNAATRIRLIFDLIIILKESNMQQRDVNIEFLKI